MQAFLNGFKQGMKDFSHGIATLVNTILLTPVYFLGIGIPALIAKFTGKRFLQTTKQHSYWHPLKKKTKEDHYRQF